MRTYTLNTDQMDLVLSALRYTTEYGYTYEKANGLDARECSDMRELIDQLDPPKFVQKEAWLVIFDNGIKRGPFDTESDAQVWGSKVMGYPGKIVRVTWEE